MGSCYYKNRRRLVVWTEIGYYRQIDLPISLPDIHPVLNRDNLFDQTRRHTVRDEDIRRQLVAADLGPQVCDPKAVESRSKDADRNRSVVEFPSRAVDRNPVAVALRLRAVDPVRRVLYLAFWDNKVDRRIDQVWTVGSTRMVAPQACLSRNSDPSRNNRIEDPTRSPDGNPYENKVPMSSRTFPSFHVQCVYN